MRVVAPFVLVDLLVSQGVSDPDALGPGDFLELAVDLCGAGLASSTFPQPGRANLDSTAPRIPASLASSGPWCRIGHCWQAATSKHAARRRPG